MKAGFTDDQLVAAVAGKRLLRLTRGVFMPAQSPDFARTFEGRDERYRLTCIARATSERAGDDSVPLSGGLRIGVSAH